MPDERIESTVEFDNWPQDQAAMDLEEKHPAPGMPTGSEIARYADVAMWTAVPDEMGAEHVDVLPRVTLIHMTPNPVRELAAASELYAGRPVRSAAHVSRSVAENWFKEMTKTALLAPLEFIDLHFLFEGVTRAFTHQLVRQRTAVYVQESMRFAVKENAAWEVAKPWSIRSLAEDDPRRVRWDQAVQFAAEVYGELVSSGIAAEDARGLLPTNITTRVHYKTNLRNLAEHAGLRLCSQAQEEWKLVWAGILEAIRTYLAPVDRWQSNLILDLFKPICYQTGKCEFMGDNDRYCPIRERVQAHHHKGEAPPVWIDIDPREPLIPGAARKAPGQ